MIELFDLIRMDSLLGSYRGDGVGSYRAHFTASAMGLG